MNSLHQQNRNPLEASREWFDSTEEITGQERFRTKVLQDCRKRDKLPRGLLG